MTFEVTERQALLIVAALGTYQNRVGQKARWYERKRLTSLRSKLADCVVIGDDEEAGGVRKSLKHIRKLVDRDISLGIEISTLRERIKAEAGITDDMKVKQPAEDE